MTETCKWYLACTNDAAGTTPHPILGNVPICQRCADKHSLPISYPVAQRAPAKHPHQVAIAAAAEEHLGIETLERRNSDSLDFREVFIPNLEKALVAAYAAGFAAGARKGGE